MPDNKKIPMTPEERSDAVQVIRKLRARTMFLARLLDADAVGESEANVHMSLMRQSYDDLAALLRTDAISRELDETHALCRKANARVRELEAQSGKSITAEAAVSRLKALTDWFATWWKLSGFHYMETTWLQWGIQFRSSHEIDHRNARGANIRFGDKELAMQVGPVVPYLFEAVPRSLFKFLSSPASSTKYFPVLRGGSFAASARALSRQASTSAHGMIPFSSMSISSWSMRPVQLVNRKPGNTVVILSRSFSTFSEVSRKSS